MEAIVAFAPGLLRVADMVMTGVLPPLATDRDHERVRVVLRTLLARGIIPPMNTSAIRAEIRGVLASLYHRALEARNREHVHFSHMTPDMYNALVFAELSLQTLLALLASRIGRTRNPFINDYYFMPGEQEEWLGVLVAIWLQVAAKRYIDTGELPAGVSFAELVRHRGYFTTVEAEHLFTAYLDQIQAGNEVADQDTLAAIVRDIYFQDFTDAFRQRVRDAMEPGERYARRYEWLALVNRAVLAGDVPAPERRIRRRG
jgi:hypothetical protein